MAKTKKAKWTKKMTELSLFLIERKLHRQRITFVVDDRATYSGILTRTVWSEDKKNVLMTFLMDPDTRTYMAVNKHEAKLYGYDLEEPSIGD